MSEQQMSDQQWNTAHDMAFELVDRGTDPNELGKLVAFVRRHQNDPRAKQRLMTLLQRMAAGRNALIRSGQTRRYYGNLRDACQSHLHDVNDPGDLLRILGWCLRLMRYYRAEPKRAADGQRRTASPPRTSAREGQTEPSTSRRPKPRPAPIQPKEPPKPSVRVGDRISAMVLRKDGSKVTVKLQTPSEEEVTFEQPYYPGQVGARVKVKVQAVDGEGKVTKVVPG